MLLTLIDGVYKPRVGERWGPSGVGFKWLEVVVLCILSQFILSEKKNGMRKWCCLQCSQFVFLLALVGRKIIMGTKSTSIPVLLISFIFLSLTQINEQVNYRLPTSKEVILNEYTSSVWISFSPWGCIYPSPLHFYFSLSLGVQVSNVHNQCICVWLLPFLMCMFFLTVSVYVENSAFFSA